MAFIHQNQPNLFQAKIEEVNILLEFFFWINKKKQDKYLILNYSFTNFLEKNVTCENYIIISM